MATPSTTSTPSTAPAVPAESGAASSGEIDVSTLDAGFMEELKRCPEGENLMRCFACGKCTAGCPVADIEPRYNPRRIIRMIVLGMSDEVLRDAFVELCSNCYMCEERCPQGVSVAQIVRALKHIAVQRGIVHPSFKMQADLLRKSGRLYEIEDFDNKKRAKMGLPELTAQCADIDAIYKKANLDDKLKQQ